MPLHLMRPEWLWALLPAVLLILLLWHQRGRSGSWHTVIAPELLQHLVGDKTGSRQVNFLPLIFLGWIFAAFAASGPSWQKIPQPIHQKQDALVILLDLSYSMKSADLPPSRLDRARQKLLDLLRLRKEGQTGLIAYAGDAHIVTPLTDDIPTIANLLPALHPDMMPLPGSNTAEAVARGIDLLHSAGIRQGKLLLVTDDVSDKETKRIVKALKGSGTELGVMGVGTPAGAPIPLARGGFLKDPSGTIVMPGLDEAPLRTLAAETGGRYMRLQLNDRDFEYLLAPNPLMDTEQTLALDRSADTWQDQGYLFLLPLLPLVLALFRRGWLLCLMPLLLLSQPPEANAQGWDDLWLTPDQQGQRALQRDDPEAAAALFKNPDWAGTAAYRHQDYESASEHFKTASNADALYNLGNSLARSGKLDDAISAYEESLKLQPDQQDAVDNLALLEKLKEQQEEQEQQDGDSQEQDQGENQQQGQDQDQDQDQDQQQQNEQSSDSSSQQDAQQNEAEEQEQQESGQQEQESGEQPEESQNEQQSQTGAEESEPPSDQEQGQQAQPSPEELERDQAMEQWLRRVPDDPSGLLREKFRYESQQRQKQGAPRDNDKNW